MKLIGLEAGKSHERTVPIPVDGLRHSSYARHRRYAIPITCPAAFSFYLNYLVFPHSWLEILWITLSRRWPRLGRLLLLFRQGKNGGGGMEDPNTENSHARLPDMDILNQELQRRLQDAGIKPSGDLTLLTLKDHQNHRRNQTVAFIFDDATKIPLAVAKISIGAGRRLAMKTQNETLRRIGGILESEEGLRIPRPLAFFNLPPLSVALESYLPGCTFYFEMRNSWDALREAPEHFGLALKCLIRFQNAAGLREIRLSSSVMDHVMRPLEALAAKGHPSPAEIRLIENTRNRAKGLLGEKLILAACHGDFWAGNLVNHGGAAGLIDWEGFEPESLPFEDLLFFSTTYGLNFPWRLGRWAVPQAAFRATYLQATEIAHLVRDYVFEYCRAMDLSSELIDVFFPAFLAGKAMRDALSEDANADALGGDSAPKDAARLPKNSRAQSESENIWRCFFRLYAERGEPACFSDQSAGKGEIR